MEDRSIRVLVASERLDSRLLLKHIVESEEQAVIVAEAENGTKALNLARYLRPDIALIDSSLPYVAGLDDVRFSRIAGLDVAQSIAEDIPNMRVVVLNGNDTIPWLTLDRDQRYIPYICRERSNACVPFTMADLKLSDSEAHLIFANIRTREEWSAPSKLIFSDRAILWGIGTAVLGWLMILMIFLAPIGAILVGAGLLLIGAGFVEKAFRNHWRRLKRR